MSVTLVNVVTDRSRVMQQRVASKFDPEPYIAGRRLRLNQKMVLDDAHYERIKHLVAPYVQMGVIEVRMSGKKASMKVEAPVQVPTPMPPVVMSINPDVSKLELDLSDSVQSPTSTVTTTTSEPAGASVTAPPMKDKAETKKDPGKKKLV